MQIKIDFFPDEPDMCEITKDEVRAIMRMLNMVDEIPYDINDLSSLISAVFNNEKNTAVRILQSMLGCSTSDAKYIVDSNMIYNTPPSSSKGKKKGKSNNLVELHRYNPPPDEIVDED
jgi:hypothetical protein